MADRIDPAEVLANETRERLGFGEIAEAWGDVSATWLAALSEHFVLVPRSLLDDGPVAVVAGEDGPEVRRAERTVGAGVSTRGSYVLYRVFDRLADDTEEAG